jgi:cation transport ATPase
MPAAKKFEPDSRFAIYDLNHDGTVTDEEMAQAKEMLEMELREEKAEAQKRMAWVAVASMIAFMLLPLLPFIPDNRLQTLASLSDMLFLSQASIVGFYFGAQAYMSRK